jgi:hypothetical protein
MAGQPPERLPELPWVFTGAFPSDEAGVGMRGRAGSLSD